MLVLNDKTFCAEVDDKSIELTKLEWKLINYLNDNSDRVCTKEEILENIWRENKVVVNTIEIYVKYLRNKLGDQYIKTRHGFGYRININPEETK